MTAPGVTCAPSHWSTVQRATERACAHGGRCHSMPYHMGLQVLRGVYPEVSAEGVVPSQNLCQNLWWDGVLLKNCVKSCRVATIEFIPIKPSVAMASIARESYAMHSRLP